MNNKFICAVLAGLLLAGCTEPIEPEQIIVETEPKIISLQPMPEKIYLGSFRCTAYCACEKCCGPWADGVTYTGGQAIEGQTIAVDPKVIPLGSIVEINGKQYIAEDIGGAIQDESIDIFFAEHKTVLIWGVQEHDVYLIK